MPYDVVCYWIDPDDNDSGTNHGFEIFPGREYYLKWVNEVIIKKRPNVLLQAYETVREVKLVKEEVVTRYSIDM